jgi:HSP20 family protein
MTLIRWSPLIQPRQELKSFQDEINRLFDGFESRSWLRGEPSSLFSPAVDVEESSDAFSVRVDLPGVPQKDVKVSLVGDTLTIRGERKQETAGKNPNVHRIERSFGTFERSFTFNTPVKSDGVKAQVRDGVLEIVVPKAEEAKVREIEVQVAS